jgi:acyl-CoA synthetase (AMP-forming)/AMP-acid ligase II
MLQSPSSRSDEVASTVPRNTMGKIQKKLLRESYAGLFEAG